MAEFYHYFDNASDDLTCLNSDQRGGSIGIIVNTALDNLLKEYVVHSIDTYQAVSSATQNQRRTPTHCSY